LGRIRWAGHVAPKRMMKSVCKIKSENLKGSDHLEDRGVGGWIILKRILKKKDRYVDCGMN
jgi:hypothetical protein